MERPDINHRLQPVSKREPAKKYSAALYSRLSREEEGAEDESVSISNSRRMLKAYAQDKKYSVYDEYIDDGVSGTTFDRNDFQRMIRDIKAKRVNMVIVKDLSRLGRNYSETDYYINEFFPDNNVRLIALDGSYDGDRDDNEYAPFANFFNEYYARQTSKKMKDLRKSAAKNGEFMGSMPPYGYKRSADNKRKLIIDEEAASVVRRIFELFKNGESMRHIADTLNRENVLPPQAYYFASVEQVNPYKDNAKSWCSATISAILKRNTYLGHMTQGKKRTKSFKDKTILFLPEDLWVTVQNTHDPIIDAETFDAVQMLFRKNTNSKPRRTSLGNEVCIFSNIVRCRDCGSKITLHTTTRREKVEYRLRCSRYAQHSTSKGCTPHQIHLELLSEVVLSDIRANAKLAKEDEEKFVAALYQVSQKEQAAEIDRHKKQAATARNRLKEVDRLIFAAFEKNANGILSDTSYKMLSQGYEQEKTTLESELITLTDAIHVAESQTADISKDIETLKKYAEITELTREVVTSLIRVIYISEPIWEGRKPTYDIEIRYKFQLPQTTAVTKKDTSFADGVSLETGIAVTNAN